ncbi:unannotated protein [freshwater metagenome]|uniref:histidine kinase n=1 Tax=freshwater metagenome TaxID=449393 RepID=A0A6J7DGN3_9ZZZZ|nr:HAMP domain-containing protein [Actinomycetota bacterium]
MIGRLTPRSLTGRVTLAAVVAVGAALLLAAAAVLIASARADRNTLDGELRGLAQRIGPMGGPGGGGPPGLGSPGDRDRRERGRLDPGEDRFTRLVFADGTFVAGGASVPDGFPLPAPGRTPATVDSGGQSWRTIVRDLGGGAQLQVAAQMRPLQERRRRLLYVVLAALAGALLATALITRALARLAVKPIERLRRTTDEITQTGDLASRVPTGAGPEEVDALGSDLNAMLARLEETAAGREAALESARRFAADAGHELRTPLTSLKANLATGSTDEAVADAVRLTALVEQLQQLARGEAGPPKRIEPVDLGELADAAAAAVRTRHPGVTVTLEAPDDGPSIPGEGESLRMLLDNLLQNAVNYGRSDGRILVTVEADSQGARLIVDDDGPGIPQEERAAVLERFVRGSGARGSGTGLGLSIAAAQAARHGGALELGSAPLGGLRVLVTLRGAA